MTAPPPTRISRRIAQLIAEYGEQPAVQEPTRRANWADIGSDIASVEAALSGLSVMNSDPVAIIMRERRGAVAGLLASLAGGRCSILLSPLQSDDDLARSLRACGATAVLAAPEDWDRPMLRTAARHSGIAGVALPSGTAGAADLGWAARVPPGDLAGVAATVLTSGTTGPPKRIPISNEHVDRILGPDEPPDPERARGATINSLPLVSIGGFFGVLTSAWRGRPIALMDRFDVQQWVGYIVEHRPRRIGAPPAVLRMVLDAGVPADAFRECHGLRDRLGARRPGTHRRIRVGLPRSRPPQLWSDRVPRCRGRLDPRRLAPRTDDETRQRRPGRTGLRPSGRR